MTKITKESIIETFNKILPEALTLTVFCRDVDLQIKMRDYLDAMAKRYISFKNQAITVKDGEFANIMFGFHNLLNSVKFCISSIIELKNNKPVDGWCRLIDAEEHLEFASLARGYLFGLDEYYNQLKMMEKVLFPHFTIYHSPGAIESSGKCSVCLQGINECDHLEGVLYDGIVCFEIDKKLIAFDHTAIVENPKDRRCTITKISTDDGYMMDYFTHKKLEPIQGEYQGKGMLMEGIIIQSNNLEIN